MKNLIMNLSTTIKSNILKLLVTLTFLAILTLPLLHQTLPNYTCHFSLLTSIQSDINEEVICTPYFISIMFDKDNNKINYYN